MPDFTLKFYSDKYLATYCRDVSKNACRPFV